MSEMSEENESAPNSRVVAALKGELQYSPEEWAASYNALTERLICVVGELAVERAENQRLRERDTVFNALLGRERNVNLEEI